jgi:type VI secretion system protein ImpM
MSGSFGAFGKIPSMGDFFRIALPSAFVDPWDAWLQGSMVAARQGLGARWQDCYLSAPIWRFTLSAGLAGPLPVTGVLMPSIDRVGRQFPLTLARTVAGDPAALRLHMTMEGLFPDLESLALDSLDDSFTRDQLAARLMLVSSVPVQMPVPVIERPGVLTVAGGGADGVQPDLLAHLARRSCRMPSVWTAAVDGITRMMLCDGLPGPSAAAGLFDLDAPVWRSPAETHA